MGDNCSVKGTEELRDAAVDLLGGIPVGVTGAEIELCLQFFDCDHRFSLRDATHLARRRLAAAAWPNNVLYR